MSSRTQLRLRWSLAAALKARQVALSAKSNVLYSRVKAYSTKSLRDVGGACVQLQFNNAPLMAGGWVCGIRAAHSDEDVFLPILGGAPGDHRHGRIDAMVMASPVEGDAEQVTFLPEAKLEEYLPLGTEVQVAPIWQCNDFFDLRRLFGQVDEDMTGALALAQPNVLIVRVDSYSLCASRLQPYVCQARSTSSRLASSSAVRRTPPWMEPTGRGRRTVVRS